ncbi:hypothetical protein KBY91_15380 [Streptomyces sp. RK23]|uniref:GcrA family cell cycle regulator n=1 Tax=unclassified Streptomyces TaxID=2593676 RepID=UPI001B39937F|nr:MULTISPECIES: GcrA family cell cycle regulator [unclassified Streptomyces]MBQ0969210.1 hypothetical protein [Streptomyces sp. RK74B]MBQ1004791.1 hypothetical protein [Streptomyces sp. RK23]
MARTFTQEDEEQLRQLHADGLPRNEIARQMGWAVGTITNHAQRLGLAFDREATRAATDARQADLTALRQRELEGALELAQEARERALSRYELTGFDHLGNIVTRTVRRPPAREFKDFTTAHSSAMATAIKLEQIGKESDTEKAKAALGALGTALTELYGSADDYRDPGEG